MLFYPHRYLAYSEAVIAQLILGLYVPEIPMYLPIALLPSVLYRTSPSFLCFYFVTMGLLSDLLSNFQHLGIYSLSYLILYYCIVRWRYLLPLDRPIPYILLIFFSCIILRTLTLIFSLLLHPVLNFTWSSEAPTWIISCVVTLLVSILLVPLPRIGIMNLLRSYYYRR